MNPETEALGREVDALRREIAELRQRLAQLEQAAVSPAAGASVEVPWLVIAAAVATVIKTPHRIMNLQLAGLPPLNLWSIEGRRAVFHSHQLR